MIYKKSWKYILKRAYGSYYRPIAIKNFKDVKKGDIGGYVQHYHNLSQIGNCWIYGGATVYGNARVIEDAVVKDGAQIFDSAQISGNAKVTGIRNVSHDLSKFEEY